MLFPIVQLSLISAMPHLQAPSAPPVAGFASAEREHSIVIALPPSESFGFFEPAGEKRWAPDWQPLFLATDDATLHAGTTFTVERTGPGGRKLVTVWTVLRYEPGKLIEYHNVIPDTRTTRITVRCEPTPAGTTRVTVRYLCRSLSPAGDEALSTFTAENFRGMIDGWGKEIEKYLATGIPASP